MDFLPGVELSPVGESQMRNPKKGAGIRPRRGLRYPVEAILVIAQIRWRAIIMANTVVGEKHPILAVTRTH